MEGGGRLLALLAVLGGKERSLKKAVGMFMTAPSSRNFRSLNIPCVFVELWVLMFVKWW